MNIKIIYGALLLVASLNIHKLPAQIAAEKRQALVEAVASLDAEEAEVAELLDNCRSKLSSSGAVEGVQSEILTLEKRLYELRRQREQSSARLAAMGGGETPPTEGASNKETDDKSPATEQVTAISHCTTAKKMLDDAMLRSLAKAEFTDNLVASQVREYITNYRKLNALYEDYIQVNDESEALIIVEHFDSLAANNKQLATTFIEQWNIAFDDKLYAYNLLLELLGRTDMLSKGDDICRQSILPIGAEWVSSALEQYINQKSQLLSYEQMMCKVVNLPNMSDSLRGAETKLAAAESSFPPIDIVERTFILEEPIHFSSAPKYTTKNPIPECVIYERGVNYRLSVGRFINKQPASIFHGAYPVSYIIDNEKRWQYFVGGFTSAEDAEQGRALLLKRGFRRPEVVMWRDGVMRNITENPLPAPIGYRIGIEGKAEIDADLTSQLKQRLPEGELIQVSGRSYVFGVVAERQVAEEIVALINATDSSLRVKIIDILAD